jgi:hypothetical protein
VRHCVTAETDFTRRLDIIVDDIWREKHRRDVAGLQSRGPLSPIQKLFVSRQKFSTELTKYLEEISSRALISFAQHAEEDLKAWREKSRKSERNLFGGLSSCDLVEVSGESSFGISSAPVPVPEEEDNESVVSLSSVSNHITFQDRNSQLSHPLKLQRPKAPISLPNSPSRPSPSHLPSPSLSYFAKSSYLVPKHKSRSISALSLKAMVPLLPPLPDQSETQRLYELVVKFFTQSVAPFQSVSYAEEMLKSWLSTWSPLRLNHSLRRPEAPAPHTSPLLLSQISLLVTLYFLLRTSLDDLISTTQPHSTFHRGDLSIDPFVPISDTHFTFRQPLVFHLLRIDFLSMATLSRCSTGGGGRNLHTSSQLWSSEEELKNFYELYVSYLDPNVFLIVSCRLCLPALMIACLHSLHTNPLSSKPPLHPAQHASLLGPTPTSSTQHQQQQRTVLAYNEILNLFPKFIELETTLPHFIFRSLSQYFSPWILLALLQSQEHKDFSKKNSSSFVSYLSLAPSSSSSPHPPPPPSLEDLSADLFSPLSLPTNELLLLTLLEVLQRNLQSSFAPSVKFLPHLYPQLLFLLHLAGHLIRQAPPNSSDPSRVQSYRAIIALLLQPQSHDLKNLRHHSPEILSILQWCHLPDITLDFLASLLHATVPSPQHTPLSLQDLEILSACQETAMEIFPRLFQELHVALQESSSPSPQPPCSSCLDPRASSECALRLLFSLREALSLASSPDTTAPVTRTVEEMCRASDEYFSSLRVRLCGESDAGHPQPLALLEELMLSAANREGDS